MNITNDGMYLDITMPKTTINRMNFSSLTANCNNIAYYLLPSTITGLTSSAEPLETACPAQRWVSFPAASWALSLFRQTWLQHQTNTRPSLPHKAAVSAWDTFVCHNVWTTHHAIARAIVVSVPTRTNWFAPIKFQRTQHHHMSKYGGVARLGHDIVNYTLQH